MVQELLNLSPLESAKYINYNLGLGIDTDCNINNFELNRYKQIQQAKDRFKKWHNETLQMLCNYLHSLKGIEKDKKQDIVEYYIDLLIFGTEEDWLWFKKTEERWCKEIERRVGKQNIRGMSTV